MQRCLSAGALFVPTCPFPRRNVTVVADAEIDFEIPPGCRATVSDLSRCERAREMNEARYGKTCESAQAISKLEPSLEEACGAWISDCVAR